MPYQSLAIKLRKYFPVIEGISLAGFAAGYILKIMHYPGQEIIVISLSTLSVIYFLGAYMPPEAKPGEEKPQLGLVALLGTTIVPKILGIGLSVSVIGILFMIQTWNGFREMLLIGSTSLAAASVVGLVSASGNERARKALGPLLLRAIPIMLLVTYFLRVYGISQPVN